MSRLEVIRFAWSDEDVEPMLRGAQEDIKYLIEQLEALERWASSMPDAGFTSEDPRWDWWHQRPRVPNPARDPMIDKLMDPRGPVFVPDPRDASSPASIPSVRTGENPAIIPNGAAPGVTATSTQSEASAEGNDADRGAASPASVPSVDSGPDVRGAVPSEPQA